VGGSWQLVLGVPILFIPLDVLSLGSALTVLGCSGISVCSSRDGTSRRDKAVITESVSVRENRYRQE
jgi:hypothetical protein